MNDHLNDVKSRILAAANVLGLRVAYPIGSDVWDNICELHVGPAVVWWEEDRGFVVDRLIDVAGDPTPASDHDEDADPVFTGHRADAAAVEVLFLAMRDRIERAVLSSRRLRIV